MIQAPVTNKKVAKSPLQVMLPDGAAIQSSHTCDLDLPQLPDSARKAHVIPGLTSSSLLSVGQLVDSNCSVIFEKTKVEVIHKKSKVLEGRRNPKNGLWVVDMQPKDVKNCDHKISNPKSQKSKSKIK